MAHSDVDRQKAYSLYKRGVSVGAIAKEIGAGRRTVERWRNAGDWDRDADLEPVEVKAVATSIVPATLAVDMHRDRPLKHQRGVRRIDEVLIVEDAIEALSGLLQRDNISVNSPGVGSTASALVRLLEYRRKLEPPTASELAEVAIAQGISPHEFMEELQKQWRLRGA